MLQNGRNNYLERRKQQTKDGRRFSMLKSLGKGNNCIIGLYQQTSTVYVFSVGKP